MELESVAKLIITMFLQFRQEVSKVIRDTSFHAFEILDNLFDRWR